MASDLDKFRVATTTTGLASSYRLLSLLYEFLEPQQAPKTRRQPTTAVCLTIFIFRGQPDVYSKRHAIIYFTSPDNENIHESIHVQRVDEASPWVVGRLSQKVAWPLDVNYVSHVNAGAILMPSGEERTLVDIVASTPVEGREADWNCQNFVFEGLQQLVDHGHQTQDWYDFVEDELMDKFLDGAVG